MAKKRYEHTNNNKPNFRASSIELFNRDIKPQNDNKIYTRDEDNLYPQRIELICNNSPTARRCATLMSKYIIGNGVSESQNIQINSKGEKINDLSEKIADDIAVQGGAYLHIRYNLKEDYSLDFKKDIELLDYVRMAKSKEDDNGCSGRFYRLDIKEKGLFSNVEDKTQWYYPFNDDKEIVKSQMIADCKAVGIEEPTLAEMIKHQRGQVLYLNMTPKYIYALPLIDSVYNDCDTEFRLSLYNNTQTRRGFLGQTVMVRYYDEDNDDDTEFEDKIKNSLGAENSSNVLTIDVPLGATDDLNKAFVVKQLEPQFDDKLFSSLEKSIEKRIMKAFNNIPEGLVTSGDGALFGVNAETFNQMKMFYWEQNERERRKLESTFKMLGYEVQFQPFNIVSNGSL